METSRRQSLITNAIRLVVILIACHPATFSVKAQGILVPGGGAIHRAMAGVSTATPVDAIGAVYWNPAAPSRLDSNQVGVAGEMIIPDIDVSSSLPSGAAGRTRSDNGLGMLSDVGLIYHLNERWTASMGLLTTAGGGVTFPGDAGNPILAPTGPLGNVVLGPVHSSMTILQILPNASWRVTDKLMVGFGPTVSAAVVSFTPAYFGGPNDANGDGLFSFSDGSNTRPYWGGGFRAGGVFRLSDKIDLGFGYTSPTWYETWKFYAADEIGQARLLTLTANNPAVYSWGASYRPGERLLLASDLRYIDYKNADLWGARIINSGLNWNSVFAAAFGARYQLNQRLALLAGYLYNDNPVPNVGTLFSLQAPGITQHSVSCGVSADLTDSITAAVAYIHAFRNEVSGEPIQAIGADVTYGASADSIAVTINVKFGAKPTATTETVVSEAPVAESTPASPTTIPTAAPGGASSASPAR